jgi:hypothetical protein
MVSKKVFDAVLGVTGRADRAAIESTRCANNFITGLGYMGVDMEGES